MSANEELRASARRSAIGPDFDIYKMRTMSKTMQLDSSLNNLRGYGSTPSQFRQLEQ